MELKLDDDDSSELTTILGEGEVMYPLFRRMLDLGAEYEYEYERLGLERKDDPPDREPEGTASAIKGDPSKDAPIMVGNNVFLIFVTDSLIVILIVEDRKRLLPYP